MDRTLTLAGDGARIGAARAAAAMLATLRMDHAIVGDLALHAWLEEDVPAAGSVDLLGMVQTERAGQIPRIAPDHGFHVDPAQAAEAEELDLLPMTWRGGEREVKVHLLFATNALYGRMVRESVAVAGEESELKVIRAEDLALLLLVSDEPEALAAIARLRLKLGPALDVEGLNRKLVSIGLSGKVLT
jgi:hypothetical protein